MVHFGLAFALYCQRRYDDAIEHAEKAVDLYPDYWLVHFAMGLALSQKGSLAAVDCQPGNSPAAFTFLYPGGRIPGSFVCTRGQSRPRGTADGAGQRREAQSIMSRRPALPFIMPHSGKRTECSNSLRPPSPSAIPTLRAWIRSRVLSLSAPTRVIVTCWSE